MKLVVAVIKPFKVDDVKAALPAVGDLGMTVTEARGSGHESHKTVLHRAREYSRDLSPKVRLEVAVGNGQVGEVIDMIVAQARTEQVGDGKILVVPLEAVVHIRTGELEEDSV
jgi:nitrogen regulatory protein P-II 2